MSAPTTPRTRTGRRRRVSTRSLGIADSYRLRIADAVRAGYPKLVEAIGDDAWNGIITAYLNAYPSLRLGRGAGAKLPEQLVNSDQHPAWYGELALLDRAHFELAARPETEPLSRDALRHPALTLVLIPAHALIDLVTTADQLWNALDVGGVRARPHRLDWPHTVLVWRSRTAIRHRAVDADEAAGLRLAAQGADVGALCDTISAVRTSSPAHARRANPAARALDMILRWIDDGLLARG